MDFLRYRTVLQEKEFLRSALGELARRGAQTELSQGSDCRQLRSAPERIASLKAKPGGLCAKRVSAVGRKRTECPSHPDCQGVDACLAFVLLGATNILPSM